MLESRCPSRLVAATDPIGTRYFWKRLPPANRARPLGESTRPAARLVAQGAEVSYDAGEVLSCCFEVTLTTGWQTLSASVRTLGCAVSELNLVVRPGGTWWQDGNERPDLAGCVEGHLRDAVDKHVPSPTGRRPWRGRVGLPFGGVGRCLLTRCRTSSADVCPTPRPIGLSRYGSTPMTGMASSLWSCRTASSWNTSRSRRASHLARPDADDTGGRPR